MPVFINEVTAEVPQDPVPATQAKPPEERRPMTLPENELIQQLNVLDERRQRLEFD